MSGNITCRDRYFNYGSYLRSRGIDKTMCDLLKKLQSGNITIGPITPNGCGTNLPVIVKNNMRIDPCSGETQNTTGILKITGGSIGIGDINSSASESVFLANSVNYGLQTVTGIKSEGPIYQVTDCSHSNYFGASQHIFDGGKGGNLVDCSTNVFIRGTLNVDGDTRILGKYIGETTSLSTYPFNRDHSTLTLFRSPQANGNTMMVYTDTSDNITPLNDGWKTKLAFAIDGNLNNSTEGSSLNRIAGMTNRMGHIRGFRGLTISNPPLLGQPIDICYNRDISGTSTALDIYGDIVLNPGNNDASGNFDISGGNINLYEDGSLNGIIYSSGDASFNGHVSIYDLSVILSLIHI